ncbi:MAG: SAM-dependent DNA methyltransferase [Actinomycetaceae bacterium]|nr:SAM-dependent DNA methyltransferase [Actinomycetaceae bacterium]
MSSTNPRSAPENLVKSKQRVVDHGEVFTPAWMVEAMLDLVKDESQRIDSRFLEPACGDGNFLRQVLSRKLSTVQARYGENDFERRHYALLALMCTYGIELLADNAQDCRDNLVAMFTKFIGTDPEGVWRKAAESVTAVNIVQADALTMLFPDGSPLVFPEWGYLGKGKFQRRDFEYANLTQRGSFTDTLFEGFEFEDVFKSATDFPQMTVVQIAELGGN